MNNFFEIWRNNVMIGLFIFMCLVALEAISYRLKIDISTQNVIEKENGIDNPFTPLLNKFLNN